MDVQEKRVFRRKLARGLARVLSTRWIKESAVTMRIREEERNLVLLARVVCLIGEHEEGLGRRILTFDCFVQEFGS